MDEIINYAGKKMVLNVIYDEVKNPEWQNEAQNRINTLKELGELACCIHEGTKHGFYIEHPDEKLERINKYEETHDNRSIEEDLPDDTEEY